MTAELPRDVRIAPSILSSDFARLGEQVQLVMEAGARVIHVDVMDGHFVPPITIGPLVAGSIADLVHDAGGVVDVHLMIERPERHVAEFAKAGADNITLHYEATPHIHYALGAVKEAGCQAGVAINPGTPTKHVVDVASVCDLVLCMSVNPGWGGQAFIPESLERLRGLREQLPDDVLIEVDGGVDATTASQVVQAGATLLVAGSAVFGASDPATAYAEIASAAGAS